MTVIWKGYYRKIYLIYDFRPPAPQTSRKQKNHAQHGGCFLFAGLEIRDGDPPICKEHPSQQHQISSYGYILNGIS